MPVILVLIAGGYVITRSPAPLNRSPSPEIHSPAPKKSSAVTPQDREIPNPDTGEMQAPVARAFSAARQAVVDEPNSAKAWGKFGAVCEAHGLYDYAVTCYRRAHALAPNDFRWVYLLAILQDFWGAGVDEIVSLFELAISLDPTYPAVYYRFGDALVRQGKLPEACDAYRKALELRPDLALAHRSLGQVLLSLGNPVAAMKHLEQAAKLQPDDRNVISTLARGYMLLGDRERAEEAAETSRLLRDTLDLPDPVRDEVKALAVNQKRVIMRAVKQLREGAFGKAISELKLVEESSPNNPTVHFHLGTSYMKTGQQELAITHLSKAVELQEDLIDAHLYLTSLLQERGRLEEAIHHYRRALVYLPENAEVHAKLANALRKHGDREGAIRHYRRAVQIDPNHTAAQRLAQLGIVSSSE